MIFCFEVFKVKNGYMISLQKPHAGRFEVDRKECFVFLDNDSLSNWIRTNEKTFQPLEEKKSE